MNKLNKQTVFSGVQPTGNFHLGNYLGALSQWLEMQHNYNCIFCVVDYHAITVEQNPKTFHKQILDIAKIYLASGIDPKKSLIFRQSDISEHTELAWLLNCSVARMADLKKMTQFKDKSETTENVSIGLFDYPVLMAADILLYQTNIVPVGHDQLQHIELARDLAKRFNSHFGEAFTIPTSLIRKEGARIMGLDDPTKKMSKSAPNPANFIALLDAPEVAKKKIMRAVTDSGSEIKYDQKNKPAIANLLTIYSLLANKSTEDIAKKYANKGYGDFKKDLAEVVGDFLTKFQKNYHSFSDREVEKILANGAKKLQPLAKATLEQAKDKLGF
jgi:tryptophanyl-tRNA synthetase